MSNVVSFTKKEIKAKLDELEEDLKSTKDQVEFSQIQIQRLINTNPLIQQEQQKVSQLVAQLNRLQGRKDFWLDISDMSKGKKKKLKTVKTEKK
jgi:regulator of replication initiation timing